MNYGALLKGFVVLVSLVCAGFLIKYLQIDAGFSEAWIDSDIRNSGIRGELLFVLIGGAFAAVGLPRQGVSFLAGYAFGFVEGTLLGLMATVTGCVMAFFYARLLGRNFVKARFERRIKRVDNFLNDNPFSMTLLIRFLPIGSNLVTNLAAGVSSVSAVAFIAGSAIGYIPQTAIFALLGSGVHVDDRIMLMLGVVGFVTSGVLGVYLYRKYRHGKSIGERLEQQIGGGD
ncbi:MAG: TVP38/TMEM64 family protein [Rhodospirillales bacterium]|nr:TVP38/TMEM64 family protein [Rhodospirillales bacterium]